MTTSAARKTAHLLGLWDYSGSAVKSNGAVFRAFIYRTAKFALRKCELPILCLSYHSFYFYFFRLFRMNTSKLELCKKICRRFMEWLRNLLKFFKFEIARKILIFYFYSFFLFFSILFLWWFTNNFYNLSLNLINKLFTKIFLLSTCYFFCWLNIEHFFLPKKKQENEAKNFINLYCNFSLPFFFVFFF